MLLEVALLRALRLAHEAGERLLPRVHAEVLLEVRLARRLLAAKAARPVAGGELHHQGLPGQLRLRRRGDDGWRRLLLL